MPDLIAQGVAPEHRWRRTLPPDHTSVLGRDAGFWSVPWDSRISRRHAELRWQEARLQVHRIAGSRNAVFVRGCEEDDFTMMPGEHFVIGDTSFTLTDERVTVTLEAPRPVTEQTFSAQYLKDLRFRDADERIEVLSRIPEIISSAASDEEMFVRLLNVLLSGISQAIAAAVVAVDPQQTESPITVLHWDRRTVSDRDFQPSDKLIRQAVSTDKSVVHIWSSSSQRAAPSFNPDGDWAFCTPVAGKSCPGWAIYVAGGFSGDARSPDGASVRALRDDLKFTELVATTVSSLREVRLLERSQTSLRQFFSPVVSEALVGHDPDEVLAPRETEVSVVFCDLRGFARQSEKASGNLLGLLHRVSDALGVTTRHILDQGGVVGDFHGDAAMGFWGWPFAQEDAVLRACRAALDIRAAFESASQDENLLLADFSIGIGVATGRAVAGKIGTVDQVKVTVFGPVVNLAARLEGMTKLLQAPILLDETTAQHVRAEMSRDEARIRRVAVFKPFGFSTALEVSELLPPQSAYPALSDDAIAAYEAALEALLAGNWEDAFQLLHNVPADDRVKDFLTVFIAQHNRTPPDDWDGVIPLASK